MSNKFKHIVSKFSKKLNLNYYVNGRRGFIWAVILKITANHPTYEYTRYMYILLFNNKNSNFHKYDDLN